MNHKSVVPSTKSISDIRSLSSKEVLATSMKPVQKPKKPLIDIVNPQPKAFFAYLQVKSKVAKKTAKKRISRKSRSTK